MLDRTRRLLAAVMLVAAVVAGVIVASGPAETTAPGATCGWVMHLSLFGIYYQWECWGAGGGSGGSW